MAPPERTILQLTQKDFATWLEYYGQKLYQGVRDDLKADLRRQDARWQSLNARISELATRIERIDGGGAKEIDRVAAALYALRNELKAQQVRHRDPFGVFAALLRDLKPGSIRVGHAVWEPKVVDAYLRDTWQLTDPEVRRYKTVWREAKLIGVERDDYARKFTVARGVVAYRFAVPLAVFDLFRVEPPEMGEVTSAGLASLTPAA